MELEGIVGVSHAGTPSWGSQYQARLAPEAAISLGLSPTRGESFCSLLHPLHTALHTVSAQLMSAEERVSLCVILRGLSLEMSEKCQAPRLVLVF